MKNGSDKKGKDKAKGKSSDPAVTKDVYTDKSGDDCYECGELGHIGADSLARRPREGTGKGKRKSKIALPMQPTMVQSKN